MTLKKKIRLTVKEIRKRFKFDSTLVELEIFIDENCSIFYEVKK